MAAKKKAFNTAEHLQKARENKKLKAHAKDIADKPRFVSDAIREMTAVFREQHRELIKTIKESFKSLEQTIMEVAIESNTEDMPPHPEVEEETKVEDDVKDSPDPSELV